MNHYVILKNGGVPTKILVSQQQLILSTLTLVSNYSLHMPLVPDGQICKLCNFHKYFNENIRNERKIVEKIRDALTNCSYISC